MMLIEGLGWIFPLHWLTVVDGMALLDWLQNIKISRDDFDCGQTCFSFSAFSFHTYFYYDTGDFSLALPQLSLSPTQSFTLCVGLYKFTIEYVVNSIHTLSESRQALCSAPPFQSTAVDISTTTTANTTTTTTLVRLAKLHLSYCLHPRFVPFSFSFFESINPLNPQSPGQSI